MIDIVWRNDIEFFNKRGTCGSDPKLREWCINDFEWKLKIWFLGNIFRESAVVHILVITRKKCHLLGLDHFQSPKTLLPWPYAYIITSCLWILSKFRYLIVDKERSKIFRLTLGQMKERPFNEMKRVVWKLAEPSYQL